MRNSHSLVVLLAAVGTEALRLPPLRMQMNTADTPAAKQATSGVVVPTSDGWQTVVSNARARAAAVKEDQDAVTANLMVGTLASLSLPGVVLLPFDNLFADLILSSLVGGVLGGITGFSEGAVGDAARNVGKTSSSVARQIADKLPLDKLVEKTGMQNGLSMKDIKKYGVAGTLAYILTELAFWAVAFPVASTSFYNLNGHWPDFSDGSDRGAVLAFIFAGANIARLVVPLRFGAAFALAPWVEENICQKFGIGGGSNDSE